MKILKRDAFLYLFMLASVLSYYFYRIIFFNAGGDLMLRVSEARYFMEGINPFYVYIAEVEKIDRLGQPNAYSFISYILMIPFTYLENNLLIKILYSIIDVLMLSASMLMISKICDKKFDLRVFSLIGIILLMSVFFWQHVWTLNYNIFVLFFVTLYFYGEKIDSKTLSILSLVLVGIKPSIAIPLLLYAIVCRKRSVFLTSSLIYIALLLISSLVMSTNPLLIPVQILETQKAFSSGGTDGILLILKPFIANYMPVLSLVLVFTIIFIMRKKIKDNIVLACSLVITLGLSLFYNNVHAWIIAIPMLCFVLINRDFKLFIFAGIPLILFLLVPRLAGIVNDQYRDTYFALHNIARFGILYLSLFFLYTIKPSINERI